ncbi:MAG: DUF374 domain-containing protein [Ignavibacteriae bacterium]|nr:DUF374 domain-containing protein [Ignavibacteriota bacterium]
MIQKILQHLFINLLHILASTWRITTEGNHQYQIAVIAFWHGTMLGCWKYFGGKRASAVTSLSKDGDVLALLLKKWKYNVIRGSSSKGGGEVLDQMTENARTSLVLVTPDGPRGPIHQFKAGAAVAAQRAEVPLVLCKVEADWKITLRSWDKFEIPLPFSKITIKFLSPVFISKDAERDEMTVIIENAGKILNS